ncbi:MULTISPECIES: DUF3892 domain-containing protein [Nocardia]|uniref:DUF3892 domain-containing protein n=1 Tax=Nocardia TaxID=1817 RepID=UPI0007A452E6|nr:MULTISPECIES: DUF3892 domain-containing protein [Nocardia]MBF6276389.1 DUF3892 domain-containing protein [Nocardia nova]OBA46004.1 hypothetical protein A5789_05835 [Nocardia sp. 852002-51101_SCH5132738]OBB38589.1 hypothetical protein A5748_02740 [Nocardia sp. 852002-51244_SCH5132740]OBF82935.1 hypothetical protein A9X06_18385 [Mycobacterium sp. 852002-51759_SCH5129042]
MAIRITAIHLEGGYGHEHIQQVQWTNPATNETRKSSRAEIVAWIENEDGKAYVEQPPAPRAWVHVVTPGGGRAKYLQTKSDGVWSNNLLSLPRF